MSDSRQLSVHSRLILPYREAAVALLLCTLLGVSACSSSDSSAGSSASSEDAVEEVDSGTAESAAVNQDKRTKRANTTLRRLIDISGKLYNSAYRNNWQKAAVQFNRLQEQSDRLDLFVADGVIEDIDIETLLVQLDTLEGALTDEQQISAMVAANEIVQTGLDAAETVDLGENALQMAELAYYGRELELVALSPENSAGPEQTEALKQAADQVIQAWDDLDAAALGSTKDSSAGQATGKQPDPASSEPSADEPAGKADNATRVGRAVNQLRQSPEDYAPLARKIIVGSQRMLAEQTK